MKQVFRCALVCVAAGFFTEAVFAQSEQEVAWCMRGAPAEQMIRGCTAMISSGRYSGNDLATAFRARGNAYAYGKAQYDLAIADYDQSLRLNIDNKDNSYGSLNGRCFARAMIGQLQEALADCNESLRLVAGQQGGVFDTRGLIYLKLGDLDRAIVDYDSALRLRPKLAESLYGRGIAKRKKGDIAGGNADIAAAKAIRADIVELFATYGVK